MNPTPREDLPNEVLRCIRDRRSVRSFRTEQLDERELMLILEAGAWAASARNYQAGRMAVIQDPETRATLSRLNAQVLGKDIDPFFGAPTVVAVFADTRRRTFVEDGSLMIGNMMLAARSLGIGSCWIHRAREVFDLPEGRALARRWGLSDDFVGVGHCILGYPEGGWPPPKPRREDLILRI